MAWRRLTPGREGILVLLGEVKQPVRVFRQQLHAIEVGVRQPQLGDEAWICVDINGDGDGGDDSTDEEGEAEEHHAEDLPVECAGLWGRMRLLAAELVKLVGCRGFLAGGEVVEEGDGGVVGYCCACAEVGDDFADAGWDEGHCGFSTCRDGVGGRLRTIGRIWGWRSLYIVLTGERRQSWTVTICRCRREPRILGPGTFPLARLESMQYACLNGVPPPNGAVVIMSSGLDPCLFLV